MTAVPQSNCDRAFPRRRGGLLAGGVVLLIALSVFAYSAKGRGWKTWALRQVFPHRASLLLHPSVTGARPADRQSGVGINAAINAEVSLPNRGRSINPATVTPANVRLFRTSDHHPVPSRVNTSGGGDIIVLKPLDLLEANTQYTFEIVPAVQDDGGAGFTYYQSTFTTAAGKSDFTYPLAFTRVELPVTAGQMAPAITIGPDHRLYAAAFGGAIARYEINADGTLQKPQTITTMLAKNHGPRLVTGLRFDPSSTSSNLVLWISHGQMEMKNAQEWTGKISRLSGADLTEYQDFVINLPRSTQNHLNNQMDFGPDGAMYFAHASNTAMGARDSEWGYRPERLLTAAILRLDTKGIASPPLDAKTEEGGTYDPSAPGAPLTIYATGVRNAYDLVWHSNGKLYAPVNGSAAGGAAPASHLVLQGHVRYEGPAVPGIAKVTQTMDDTLLTVEKDAYYGHPNPARGEYVLFGGNPTSGPDPQEVLQYPVGTLPDRNYHRPSFEFGKDLAPTGIIEYKSRAFGGALQGKLLVTRYSGGKDVVIISLGAGGEILDCVSGVEGMSRLHDPVDLVEDTTSGFIYISELGGGCISLLKPAEGRASAHAFRQGHADRNEARAN